MILIKRIIYRLFGVYLFTNEEIDKMFSDLEKQRISEIVQEVTSDPSTTLKIINAIGKKTVMLRDKNGIERQFTSK